MSKVIVIISLFVSQLCWAQNKMDLEDLDIKGELHNDDRLKIIARDRNKIKNYVKYRTNYRKEITGTLPRPKAKYKY